MKYLLLIIISGLAGYYWLAGQSTPPDTSGPSVLSPTRAPTMPPAATIPYGQGSISYHLFTLTENETVHLYPNYSNRQSVKKILEEQSCHKLINAGFYDPQNRPIGLMISNFNTLSSYRQNKLFDGFVSISQNQVTIQTNLPAPTTEHAVQTGPLLVIGGNQTKLSLTKDEPRRRLIALTDTNNNAHFMVVYDPNTAYGGPLLKDLPNLVQTIAGKESILVSEAINLDGGSASAFYIKDTVLIQELNPIGSYFCITST
jgi:uncharacterized protein YigE (DUF2233 family)